MCDTDTFDNTCRYADLVLQRWGSRRLEQPSPYAALVERILRYLIDHRMSVLRCDGVA